MNLRESNIMTDSLNVHVRDNYKRTCEFCLKEIEGKPFYLPSINSSGKKLQTRCCKSCFWARHTIQMDINPEGDI
jgi:hypothetical protein